MTTVDRSNCFYTERIHFIHLALYIDYVVALVITWNLLSSVTRLFTLLQRMRWLEQGDCMKQTGSGPESLSTYAPGT